MKVLGEVKIIGRSAEEIAEDLKVFLRILREDEAGGITIQGVIERWRNALKAPAAPIARVRSGLRPLVSTMPRMNWSGTEIFGTAQKTRTVGHDTTVFYKVKQMAQSGEYEYIVMNRSLKVATGLEDATTRVHPDIIGVRWNGKIDVVEVLSPGQSEKGLLKQLEEALKTLPEANRGKPSVIPNPYYSK